MPRQWKPTRMPLSETSREKYIRQNYPEKPLVYLAADLGVSRRVVKDWVRSLGLGIHGVDYSVHDYDDPNYKENLEWIMQRPNTKLNSVQAKEIGNSEYYVGVVKEYNRKNYKIG